MSNHITDSSETKTLYLDDSYQTKFSAKIIEIIKTINQETKNIDSVSIILDQTLFYPRGGGQPSDTGIIRVKDKEYKVLEVVKRDGRIIHNIDKENSEIKNILVNDIIEGIIDWERRYILMRMHTAAHLIDNVLYEDGKILATGNELGIDKSRIDFNMPEFNLAKVQEYIDHANQIILKDLEVKNYYLEREEAFKIPGIVKLAGALPPNIPILRITEIAGIDIQADGGTHVKSLKELGKIKLLTIENKGKDRKRIYFTLEN